MGWACHRLGRRRTPARRQQVPRAVRDALPRTRRAQGTVGGAGAAHDARQGMAERGRVPARGGAGRRRPFLRHPRGAACGPPGRRRRARRAGAGRAGEGRAVGCGDEARRRPAAVCRRAVASGERHGQAGRIGSREGAGVGQSRRVVTQAGTGSAL